MSENFEDGGDSSFAGSIGEEDLQKINVALPKTTQPTQSYFNWLDNVTSMEKGKSFFSWLNN